MSSYTLLPYDKDNLADVLSGKFPNSSGSTFTTPEEVKDKNHFAYLAEYLSIDKGLGAKTIIAEHNYISKDYLVDYASYYASCFDDYPKKCNRIHFFSEEFSVENFEDIIIQEKEKNENFWNSYLGYVIAKPIPLKVIGKTVLKTYPRKDSDSSDSDRIYFGNRIYDVNIFGNKIALESLAFMEQDGVVSVCATAAIWMMLQKASCNSYALLKTPSEITDEADIVGTHGERLFPNKGLSIKQISKAIFHSGLVSEIRTEKKEEHLNLLSNSYLKRVVNAYAPIGIPLVLVLKVPYNNSEDNPSYGYHAITVTGYKTIKYQEEKASEIISWRSDCLTKLFVHDDGWGPFARVDFGAGEFQLINNWSKKYATPLPSKLTDIVIPVYHKIRISYDDVEIIVKAIDKILWRMYKDNTSSNISWDIKLMYSESFKSKSKSYEQNLSRNIHLKLMPKYIWVADCYIGNILIFQILFDATDVAIGMFGLSIYFHSQEIKHQINDVLEAYPNFADYFYHPSKTQFYEFLKNESKYVKLKKGKSFDL